MNRSPFAPSPAVAARFPSGWRARLARDPIPALLRVGPPALSARVRRVLIYDYVAPRGAEVLAYADVKAFLKKQSKKADFPAKPLEKGLGSEKFASVVATVRALERMAELDLDAQKDAVAQAAEFVLATQGKDGGIAALAIGETKTERAKLPAVHFQGWAVAALCRVGLDSEPRVQEAFQFKQQKQQTNSNKTRRGVRSDSSARPSCHLTPGMAWRAFAAPPPRRSSRVARRDGD